MSVSESPWSSMVIWSQPAPDQWRMRRGNVRHRDEVGAAAASHAGALGTAPLEPSRPIIATGHQAWLWHPGILAKYIAASVAAEAFGAASLHVVVDHDTHETVLLELPTAANGRLQVRKIRLSAHGGNPAMPTGSQPPLDPKEITENLRQIGDNRLAEVEQAFAEVPPLRTLAEQMTAVLQRLLKPYTGPMSVIFASEMASWSGAAADVRQMLTNPHACVEAYNQAVTNHPGSGVTPLTLETDRVELPLWLLEWQQPRRRVYVRIIAGRGELVSQTGKTIDPQRDTLAPRVLLLSAWMRSLACDAFIHGRGGGDYDLVTDDWWRSWTGHELAPRWLVSADLRLPLDVPIAQRSELTAAKWRRHHLPFNLDRQPRAAIPNPAWIEEKQRILSHMNDDRDRNRRALLFRELHWINDAMAQANAPLIREVEDDVRRAKLGVANRQQALRRDWCFALYPPEALHELRRQMAAGLSVDAA
ncbi:MAG: hypothetical protein IT440_08200 [Phycisphaeraceae bacterium]|nr:hypothetical protein [Phycisphaeraceae bacterium]